VREVAVTATPRFHPENRIDADVVVVGGGPVGLAMAIALADAGRQVQVWEPRNTPIDKACGEGLMPSAVARLQGLGVDTDFGFPFQGITYLEAQRRGGRADGQTRTARASFADGPGLGVRRTHLHAAMHDRAVAAGAKFVEASAHTITQDRHGVTVAAATADGVDTDGVDTDGVDTDGAVTRAHYVVGADGLHSKVRKAANITQSSPGTPRFGLRRHYAIEPWSDTVDVHWAARSEAYVTPVGPGLVGVAILTASRGSFDEQLAEFPLLRDRLAAVTFTPTLGSGPLRQNVARRTSGRIALVGDAAGYVDALTGEGLNVGFASAQALTRCLLADRLEDYEAQWRAASRRYRAMTQGLLWARSQPSIAPRIVPIAARWPRLFAGAVHQLS